MKTINLTKESTVNIGDKLVYQTSNVEYITVEKIENGLINGIYAVGCMLRPAMQWEIDNGMFGS